MSFLRALRAYIGLAPDEEIEGRYLYELDARRRELDLRDHERSDRRVRSSRQRDEVDRWEVDLDDEPSADHQWLNPEDYDDLVNGFEGADTGSRTADERPGSSRMVTVVNARSDEADRGDRVDNGDGLHGLDLNQAIEDGFRVVDRQRADPTGEVDLRLDPVDDAGRSEADLFTEYIPTTGSAADGETEDDKKNRGAAADKGGQEAVVRSLDSMRAKPRTLIPDSFGDAKVVADEFKRGIPVVLNLQSLERELARRLIDFASGLCYALDGSMEKIASQVFLLTPEEVEVSDEDRRRIEERGYAR